MANTPSRLKQTSLMDTCWPASLSRDDTSMIVGQARPPKSNDVVSLLGSQPMSSTFLPCCAIIYDRLASEKLLPMPPLP